MQYYLYILRTSANTLYIGQTNNLERRLKEHQNKKTKSAKYIRYFTSSELVYTEEFATRTEAMKREVELKKWTKKKKEVMINRGLNYLLGTDQSPTNQGCDYIEP